MNDLQNRLKKIIKGEILTDEETLSQYSHDASIFELKPQAVVFPADIQDLKALVKFASENKKINKDLSLTARSAGTDMGGGSINDSLIVVFTKYFNKVSVNRENKTATSQPGVFFRDFDRETKKYNLIFPSYPASRDICAIGGIVNNNSGGEKSLKYGKTNKYVKSLKMVLSDGNEYEFQKLKKNELKKKLEQKDFEGEIYRKTYELIDQNYELLRQAKPKVSKNSAGYYLWDVYDKDKETFDLTQLFTGAQGTLGFLSEVTFNLVPVKNHAEMVTVFLNDFDKIGYIVNLVLPLNPESIETYDDKTLKLAIKYFYSFAQKIGAKNVFSLFFDFLPEFWLLLKGGVPKLVVQIELNENSQSELKTKINELLEKLKPLKLRTHTVTSMTEENKYWVIRRESFNLLRQKIHDKHTAPFIDDFVVPPQFLPEFLPKLDKILAGYPSLVYTIAGHLGDGNFHIIPLMNIEDPKQKEIIPVLSKQVYDLVLSYKGSITGEHNDGLIRTPYLKQMYGEKVYKLFEEIKKIFDPQDIFNPRKKVGATLSYSMNHVRTRF